MFAVFDNLCLSHQDICEMTQSIYIPRGVNTESLSRTVAWDFSPAQIKVSCK